MWRGIMCLEKIFNACWRESVSQLLFFCSEMHVNYIIDLHKLLFYKRLMSTDNLVLMLLFNVAHFSIKRLCSKYNVILGMDSIAAIRLKVWRQFCSVEGLIG